MAEELTANSPVVILGAGAAGISCALWLHNLEVPFRWLCAAEEPGGTLLRVGNPVVNYPGVHASNGREIVEAFTRQLCTVGIGPELGVRAESIAQDDDYWRVTLRDQGGKASEVICPQLVIATGTKPRMLGLEHERELLGKGVEISVTRNRERYAGKRVCIVGGGDAALEGALILQDCCPQIHLVHRRTRFPAQERFVERVRQASNITMHLDDEVQRILPGDEHRRLHGVELKSGRELHVEGLFVRIGVSARYPAGLPSACINDDSYLRVDESGQTPMRGLYAAGDVTGAAHQSVAAAVGGGARCATAIQAARSSS